MIRMPRNSFVQMNKLTNVSGRITYISSKAKQENLYATYTTVSEQSITRKVFGRVGLKENVLRQGN